MRTTGVRITAVPLVLAAVAPVLIVVGPGACVAPPPSPAPSGLFQDYFEPTGEFTLEDVPGDLLGEIGPFLEAVDGDLLVVDALRPEVRRFDAEGRLRASYGAVGEGPFEFRRITGMVDDEEGRVYLLLLTVDDDHLWMADSRHYRIHRRTLSGDTAGLEWQRQARRPPRGGGAPRRVRAGCLRCGGEIPGADHSSRCWWHSPSGAR